MGNGSMSVPHENLLHPVGAEQPVRGTGSWGYSIEGLRLGTGAGMGTDGGDRSRVSVIRIEEDFHSGGIRIDDDLPPRGREGVGALTTLEDPREISDGTRVQRYELRFPMSLESLPLGRGRRDRDRGGLSPGLFAFHRMVVHGHGPSGPLRMNHDRDLHRDDPDPVVARDGLPDMRVLFHHALLLVDDRDDLLHLNLLANHVHDAFVRPDDDLPLRRGDPDRQRLPIPGRGPGHRRANDGLPSGAGSGRGSGRRTTMTGEYGTVKDFPLSVEKKGGGSRTTVGR